ncbi:MAG: rhodanese-like domain-containing protein [Salinivirgaceae bacterium]|nr:MAG: rhodanese-like domain-containing protein [Salinivirgaceae bacterium]
MKLIEKPKIQTFDLPGVEHISSEEAWTLIKTYEAILVDVREDHECAIETIDCDSTIYQPMSTIMQNIDEIPKFKPLIIVCKEGIRSVKVVNLLNMQGFENVYNLDGGIITWKKKNLPIDSIFDGEHCHDCHGDCKSCN